jgi:hypothetical protein
VFACPPIFVDNRMNTTRAGENIFCFFLFRCYWWERMKVKTHAKLNISLPLELHAWCIQKMKSEQRKKQIGKVGLSHVISHVLSESMEREIRRNRMLNETPENAHAQPHSGPSVVIRPHASAGGSKTPKIVKYEAKKRRA